MQSSSMAPVPAMSLPPTAHHDSPQQHMPSHPQTIRTQYATYGTAAPLPPPLSLPTSTSTDHSLGMASSGVGIGGDTGDGNPRPAKTPRLASQASVHSGGLGGGDVSSATSEYRYGPTHAQPQHSNPYGHPQQPVSSSWSSHNPNPIEPQGPSMHQHSHSSYGAGADAGSRGYAYATGVKQEGAEPGHSATTGIYGVPNSYSWNAS